MKLIKGNSLTERQRTEVLNAFGYRWTKENEKRAREWFRGHGHPTVVPVTDAQWLKEHAFWFLNDGSRLASNRYHTEPAYMVEER